MRTLPFFDLILPLSTFWHIVVLIVVTSLAASSIDTLQTAISSVFSSDLERFGMSDGMNRVVTRALLLLINIPAVILSAQRFDVIGLFLVADLVCATAVLPVFLGLITKDIHFLLPAPTELGAFLGIWSGIGAVLVNGAVIGFTEAINPITGQVIATGPWSYFWLTNSTQCALCGPHTMITFIIVPLVAGFGTLFFSRMDIILRGDRAREPIFVRAQPEIEKENYNLDDDENKSDTKDGNEDSDANIGKGKVVDIEGDDGDDEIGGNEAEKQESPA